MPALAVCGPINRDVTFNKAEPTIKFLALLPANWVRGLFLAELNLALALALTPALAPHHVHLMYVANA